MTERPSRPGGTGFEYYNAIGRTSELTTRQKLVAIVIRNHWSPKEKYNPSNATIAKQVRCGTRQVQRELVALQRLGWLRGRHRTGTTTVWTPRIPVGYANVKDSPPSAASPSPDAAQGEAHVPSPEGDEANTDRLAPKPGIRIVPTTPAPSPPAKEGVTGNTPVPPVTPVPLASVFHEGPPSAALSLSG
jgi:hypothetical protein